MLGFGNDHIDRRRSAWQHFVCKFRIAVASSVIALLALFGRSAAADNWADRLDFPAGSKVVLLHANELGLCYETNAAATKLLESGALRSASAMVPCPWFADLASWSRAHPDADVGLELTLNSEWKDYRWRPVTSDNSVASLCDADGFLWQTPVQTMVNASAADVERELLAQIDRARELGLQPSHLTTHLGTLVMRPDLIEIYLRVARARWIPAMIVELTPEQVERFKQLGYPLPEDIIELLSDYPLPKVDDLRIVADGDSYEAKKANFLKLLRELSPGITQLAFQPALASDALPRIAPDWQQRVWEAKLMEDPDVVRALGDKSIVLTDWRDLMRRFEGRPVSSDQQKSPTAGGVR